MNIFHYAMSLMNTLYGIHMLEDDWEEIALIAWGLIGNKQTRIYKYTTNVDRESLSIQLPCNVAEVEAVTIGMEEWDYSTNDTPNGDITSAFVESYIEHRKAFKNPLYAPGKFLKYEKVGNTLYFDKPYSSVTILYKGVVLDENDLPELTDKEAVAIATYCAYILKYKEGLMTNNPGLLQVAETLRAKWLLLCDLARADHYMSQNEWDNVLDAKTSWARKRFNKSFKLY